MSENKTDDKQETSPMIQSALDRLHDKIGLRDDLEDLKALLLEYAKACERIEQLERELAEVKHDLERALANHSADLSARVPNVDGQNFYELCQQYRHAQEMMPHGSPNVVQAFDNIREYVKTGKLPWPSYEA